MDLQGLCHQCEDLGSLTLDSIDQLLLIVPISILLNGVESEIPTVGKEI